MRRGPRGIETARGFVLIPTFLALGVIGLVLGAYFSLVQLELHWLTLTTARTQALYLAEAGLDAATDLLSLDWEVASDPLVFPLQERVSAPVNGEERSMGAFDVTVTSLNAQAVRVVSKGQSLPKESRDGGPAQYQVARTLSVVLVRKGRPVFSRLGAPGAVAVQVSHFDADGIPDLLAFSGEPDPSQDNRLGFSGVLSSGDAAAVPSGYHLLASLTDVDEDGDLDLVVSDAPSRGDASPAAFIPHATPSSDDTTLLGTSTTAADVFATGTPVTVTAQGWLFLPEGSLSGAEPGTDVFVNHLVYDSVQVVSWTEITTP